MPHDARDPTDSPAWQGKALVWLVLGITILFATVLWPLGGAISWAVFIAVVFAPLQERAVRRTHGRRGWAAFGTLVLIVVSVLLPMALLGASITQEATSFYTRFKSGDIQLADYFQRMVAVLPEWAHNALVRSGIEDLGALQHKLAQALGRSGDTLTARAFVIGQGTLDFVLQFFVMLYVLFFLLRDGRALSAAAARSLPLSPEHTRRLLDQFATVVRATVKGNVVVALVQGALGWLAFWFLDISAALLWGAVMALLSLLPAVGAALVWGPVAIYLVTTGSVLSGVGLAVWGVVVIGLVDNVLRPILVGKETRLPDWLVLVATLGGLSVFGPSGFVIGPVIAALFISAWDILTEERARK
jgi:predicted PurR-regulated permease PerM